MDRTLRERTGHQLESTLYAYVVVSLTNMIYIVYIYRQSSLSISDIFACMCRQWCTTVERPLKTETNVYCRDVVARAVFTEPVV